MVFLWFSHGFPMVFPWKTSIFPWVFPWQVTRALSPLGSPNVLSLPLLRPSTLRQRCPRHSRGPQRKMEVFMGKPWENHRKTIGKWRFHHVIEILCLKIGHFRQNPKKSHGSYRCFMLLSCSDDQQIRHVFYIFCGDIAILWFVAKSIVKRIETPLHPKFHHKCQLYPPGMS